MQKAHKPVVRNDQLLTVEAGSDAPAPLRVGTPPWYAWLAEHTSFVFEGSAGHFTARREVRRGATYWYAYRRRNGKFSKVYLGKEAELTTERLNLVDRQLAGQSSPLLSKVLETSEASALPQSAADPNLSFLSLAKTRPPELPAGLVARPRLTLRIQAPVTFIYAPGGFGKSTVLNEWRQACGLPVAWVSLDADDNHPVRFLTLVGLALQALHPPQSPARRVPLRTTSLAALSEAVLQLMDTTLRALPAASTGACLGLVIDDYHHLQQPEIHAALQTWLEHWPRAVQLLISSRTRPPLRLGHLRAKGVVAELDADDLRFTPEEGVAFWEQSMPEHPLAYAEMQALVKHTEGWVTGLKLATLALVRHSDPHQFVATFTGEHTYLREYFLESVLNQQPPEVQAFLLKTSILKQLTGELCEAVTGQAEGAAQLARLWQDNLFLTRLEVSGWYRYHDLFVEMLGSQLHAQCPAEIPGLHRRAADWYLAHTAPADAVPHLLASEAWEEAATLIESMALRELERFGEDSRLLHWLRQLPETVVQRHRRLLHLYVRLARMALPEAEVERFLAGIEANLTRQPAAAQTSDEQAVLAEIQRWRSAATAFQLFPADDHNATWRLLDDFLLPPPEPAQTPEAREVRLSAIYEAALAQHNLFVMIMAGGRRVEIARRQGALRRSEKLAHDVLQQALALRGTLPETASVVLLALSRICYERNQLAEAEQLLTCVARVDPNPLSTNVPVASAMLRAKIEAAQGRIEAAHATLQAAQELNLRRPSGRITNQDLLAHRAQLLLRQGDLAGAESWLRGGPDADERPLVVFARAKLRLAQQQGAAAEADLRWLKAHHPYGLISESLLETEVLLALALLNQRQVHAARQTLIEALRRASPETARRPFLDHGPACAPLLALVLEAPSLTPESRAFAEDLLRLMGDLPKARPALSAAAAISTREYEVLRLVCAGLSNHEMAARFSISDSTVKTHLRNLYRKLGVTSRTQAIMQAQALKLV